MDRETRSVGYANRYRSPLVIGGEEKKLIRLKIEDYLPQTLGVTQEDLIDLLCSGGGSAAPVYLIDYRKEGRRKVPEVRARVGAAALSKCVKALVLTLDEGDMFGISFSLLQDVIDGEKHFCSIARLEGAEETQ